MKITFLCSNRSHPVYDYLLQWSKLNCNQHEILFIHDASEINAHRDILFLVSCSEIVKLKHRQFFRYSLVLHASDLPTGRGWNPHVWQILAGNNNITLSLINAEDKVDSGDIWKKEVIEFEGHELYDEINDLLFTQELKMIDWACNHIEEATPQQQETKLESYYRLRTPEDSELDINKPIAEQFNLLRVCDPNRFPAFFYIDGHKYTIQLMKNDD